MAETTNRAIVVKQKLDEAQTEPLAVGSMIWRFDENRRVYSDTSEGRRTPSYRGHWVPCKIVGETPRSWLVGPYRIPFKVPKKGEHRGFAFTEKEVEDDCWINENRYMITRAIEFLKDPEKLRQIAKIIGWEPK